MDGTSPSPSTSRCSRSSCDRWSGRGARAVPVPLGAPGERRGRSHEPARRHGARHRPCEPPSPL